MSCDGNCGCGALTESRWRVRTGEGAGLSIPGALGEEPKGRALYRAALSGPGVFPGNLGGNAVFLPSHVQEYRWVREVFLYPPGQMKKGGA